MQRERGGKAAVEGSEMTLVLSAEADGLAHALLQFTMPAWHGGAMAADTAAASLAV